MPKVLRIIIADILLLIIGGAIYKTILYLHAGDIKEVARGLFLSFVMYLATLPLRSDHKGGF